MMTVQKSLFDTIGLSLIHQLGPEAVWSVPVERPLEIENYWKVTVN